ncbi:MAG: hypothetical protein JWQ27_2980 [Ferruginibacter sp.]|nr:hypothetical protein [Ferruginibacter sp.]
MPDNKLLRGAADRRRVASTETHEMRYLKKCFPGRTRKQLLGAVKAAGPMRRNIRNYLLIKYRE